ncbi:MAG: C40 family peptidase [Chlorobi bacterium]|nr:C40 family peptidase [Chlorobiota bacterium]
MEYGICLQALVPVRVQPGDREELTNQLLFGDLVIIKGQVKDWLLIQTVDDEYEGWVDRKQVSFIPKEEFNGLLNEEDRFSLELASRVTAEDGKSSLIFTLGARLPGYTDGAFKIKGNVYPFSGETCTSNEKTTADHILFYAGKYSGSPYQWGGRSPFGIDCSGFVQMVFKLSGILLPRDASQQVNQGETVNFIHEARAGDLAFFGETDGDITHVGIITGEGTIIHASGDVHTDTIDHQGIFKESTKQYTHHLRTIKRMLP